MPNQKIGLKQTISEMLNFFLKKLHSIYIYFRLFSCFFYENAHLEYIPNGRNPWYDRVLTFCKLWSTTSTFKTVFFTFFNFWVFTAHHLMQNSICINIFSKFQFHKISLNCAKGYSKGIQNLNAGGTICIKTLLLLNRFMQKSKTSNQEQCQKKYKKEI